MLLLIKLAFTITLLVLLIAFVIVLVMRQFQDGKHPYEMEEIDLYRRMRRWPD